MKHALPEDCFLTLPAEITPELATACADKMNLLLQVQLLGRSVNDVDSALRLLVDLARELIACDGAVLLWTDDPDEPLTAKVIRGFTTPPPAALCRDALLAESVLSPPRALLASAQQCTYPPVQEALYKLECTGVLAVPLFVGEQVTGVLELFRRNSGPFTRDDAHLVRVFTFSFESIIENLLQPSRDKAYAFQDRLTGLFNRRYFEQQLEREIDRARRHSESSTVLLVRIAGLESLKEEKGHLAIDALLQEVARGLGRVCRKSDTLARLEDGLFGAILPRTGRADMPIVAQRVFGAVDRKYLTALPEGNGFFVEFDLSASTYPDDSFSAGSALTASEEGLERAAALPGRCRYYQPPAPADAERANDILDDSRTTLLRDPLAVPDRFLEILARLCMDAVAADRVSIMVRDGEDLIVQLAHGFGGDDLKTEARRVPLAGTTVSSWVGQRREPLLVKDRREAEELPLRGGSAYRSDSFISYPLASDHELVGIVHFSNPSNGTSFDENDLARFAPLAAAVASHLQNSRTFFSSQETFLRDELCRLVDLTEDLVPGMAGHSREVARLAEDTARRLGLTPEQRERLRVSALLHDLGKISYRPHVLSEPRALSPRERALTQRHPLLSWKLLEDVPLECIDRDAILYHHEREDGSGYLHKPGADVPLAAKILAVADVYQALVSPRPYRPAVPREEAIAYLEAQKGETFDLSVVEALVANLRAQA